MTYNKKSLFYVWIKHLEEYDYDFRINGYQVEKTR